jgi:succinate-semialdehyde dehydrogenase / glutarate-semialdehyde dehydrogenase
MLAVFNPLTGRADYTFLPPTEPQIVQQITQLRQHQQKWIQKSSTERAKVLQIWKQNLLAHQAEIIAALHTDTGRIGVSEQEFKALIDLIDRWSNILLPTQSEPQTTAIPFIHATQQDVPYGVVGVISPWNIPLLLAHIDAIPALMAGSAVVIKPSEVTPRFVPVVAQTCPPELPLLYLQGDGKTGQILLEQVDLICFTGSTKTGKFVAQVAANRMIPAFLELGGKDPCVVLRTADIAKAVRGILWSAVVNTGQACQSLERVYVHEDIFDDFVHQLLEQAEKITLNCKTEDSNSIGPAISAAQVGIWKAHLVDAVLKGARILLGGEVLDFGGKWLYPTILTNVNHQMQVMTEETFGPIIPVMPFKSTEEAIHLANDSQYGLSASVYGETAEAVAVAKALNVGAVSINDSGLTTLVFDAEKQSFNLSGLGGSRTGAAAIRRFFRRKALYINQSTQHNPWWF